MSLSRESLRGPAAFVAGVVFAVGLGVAGMTRPSKVIGFLDLAGRWDPSLALVMGGAVAVGIAGFALVLRRGAPLLAAAFVLPRAKGIDGPLLLGSALFGAGWGLAGVCPGPALVAVLSGAPALGVFVLSMAAGSLAAARQAQVRQTTATTSPEPSEASPAGLLAPPQETTCG